MIENSKLLDCESAADSVEPYEEVKSDGPIQSPDKETQADQADDNARVV